MIDFFQGGVELGDLETLHRFSPVILVLGQVFSDRHCHVRPGETNAETAFSSEVEAGSHSNQVYADCVDLSAVENASNKSVLFDI
jgi:hypothetical protein